MNFTSLRSPVKAVGSFFKRNLSFSNMFIARMGQPQWNNWTIAKAVKDGYKENTYVYRSVTLVAKSGASVPWAVVKDGERQDDHHLTKLLQHPNPWISRQDMFELFLSWLELSGNATALKVGAGEDAKTGFMKETTELWPVSPDRLKPVLSKNIQEWIQGYALDMDKKPTYLPGRILHFKYMDPANPFMGIGPLQPLSKTVDIDNEQKNWNKAAMENGGVLDGVFSFKREFKNQTEADAASERINERYAKGRRIGVIGAEAKYERTGSTPQEMDFTKTREGNRDEIFIGYGIPPVYAGSQSSSTYNNFTTSELIFWFQKEIPILEDLKDTFNFSFANELEKGEEITYFLGGIDAIRRAWLERAKTARLLYAMGVPFEKINDVFNFNIEEFEGWGISYPGGKIVTPGNGETRSATLETNAADDDHETTAESPLLSNRNIEDEVEARENFAVAHSEDIRTLLDEQQKIIFKAIDDSVDEYDRIHEINAGILLADTWSTEWVPVYVNITRSYALIAANQIIVEKRQDDGMIDAIEKYLEDEAVVLKELKLIETSTVKDVMDQVRNALAEGMNANQLQQAIIDAGIFSPDPPKEPARALMLSRTITGTAGSMGQFISARETGATHKKWRDSGFEVRDEHVERNREPAVGLNARFSPKFGAIEGPRYPLDPQMPVGDRVNCRCSMSFEIR